MDKNARIVALADQIKTGWEMCDSSFQNAEKEVITLQTLCACKKNLEEHGEAFSFNAIRDTNSNTDNGIGFNEMVKDGYLEEGEFDGKPTIIVTEKLLDLVEAQFAKED